ncbi:MAG: flagellin [Hyphomicrobiales bacterium]|jgi:flagellin|nr:flagellin [Hyphomicrobiales bacterium]
MNDIVLSKGIRSNLLSLQNASALQDRTQVRLSTGRKVNSALDDPLNYFQSEGLSMRGKDLTRLLDNMGLGIKTIEAADNGLKAITRMVEQMQAGLRSALNTNATNAKLASGMDLTNRRAVDFGTNPNLLNSATPPGPLRAGDQMSVTFTVPSNPVVAATTMTFTFPGGAPGINTAQDLVAAINADPANNNATTGERYVNASIDAGGRLIIDNTTMGTLRLQWTPAAAVLPALPTNLNSLFGTFEPPLTGSTPTDTGSITAATNQTRAKFAEQYNDILQQITFAARDSGYNGTNLLYGQSLDMVFNEDASTRMIVRGVVFDSAGIGLSATDTRRSMQSDTEINAGLAKLTESIKIIRAQAATFGANNTVATVRESFTKEAVKLMKMGADNLVVADLNEEGANLLALQTRQQLSTQALSLASQSDQAILRLFS